MLLGGFDFLRRDAPQTADKPQLRQRPDDPFGRVPLPGLYPVAVVVLELVVIVVIALAKREQGEENRIARGTFRGVRLTTDGVTGAVDEEGAMLENHDARHACDQECAERAGPAVPPKTEKRRQNEAD